MNKILRNTMLSATAVALLTGCTGNKLDVLSYPKKVKDKVQIPEICMPEYKSAMPTVAVMDFTNNSGFGSADSNTKSFEGQRSHRGGAVAGIVAGPGAVGVGVAHASNTKVKTNSESLSRKIDPKLSASVTGPLETLVVNSGGAKLFTRSDMDKVNAELKFQDSGLIDPDSAVEFGKVSGVRYIITGSIDSVDQKYRDNSSAAKGINNMTKNSDNNAVKLLGALASIGASVTDGMIINTKMTVKILDVQTGKIVFSKQLEESANIGKIRKPNYDQVIGGIKKGMMDALPDLKENFANYFAVKGYITQIKTDAKGEKRIAQINIGRDLKVEESQVFKVYAFEENEDPMTGKTSCDVIETTTKLEASQQITPKTTWATVDGDAKILKLGQLVQKSHEKAGFAIPKF